MLPYMSAELVISLFQVQEGLPNIEADGRLVNSSQQRTVSIRNQSVGLFEMLLIRFVGQRRK